MRISRRRWDGAGAESLAEELRSAGSEPADLTAQVAAVIERVRRGADAALLELCARLDGARPESLWLGREALEDALESATPELRDALGLAAANIRAVAEAQLDEGTRSVQLPQGHEVGVGSVPVEAAAVYAPGGRAAYPSSVLMGVVAARVAGVERVVVASPASAGGRPHPTILAAAALAGADAVLAAGGAHGVAALAYGTESIEAVDVIAGPGGPWVQEAKLQVSRRVGIDGYAGPSELMVICDEGAALEWIALDLCAQAEHGADSPLVVACSDPATLERLAGLVERTSAGLPSVKDATLQLVEVPDAGAAAELARRLAPEHLQIDCAGAEDLPALIPTAGCIFLGPFGATAFGDYAAGSNHTLPTGGAGRFTGPLGPSTFRRRTSEVRLDRDSAAELAGAVEAIALAEGFPAHAASARARAEASGPTEQAS